MGEIGKVRSGQVWGVKPSFRQNQIQFQLGEEKCQRVTIGKGVLDP